MKSKLYIVSIVALHLVMLVITPLVLGTEINNIWEEIAGAPCQAPRAIYLAVAILTYCVLAQSLPVALKGRR